jgi:hypothetical protein
MIIIIIISLADKPEIQRGPDKLYRAVEGQNIILPCEISGTPTPKVIWSTRDRLITGGRYVID